MYSHEIQNYLQSKNYHITISELTWLRNQTPQIQLIRLDMVGEIYSDYTMKTKDGYSWIIHTKNYNK